MLTRLARLGLGAALVAAVVLPSPAASADGCADAEVVFARGQSEPPGLGRVGEAFVNHFRSQVPDLDVSAYPVDYPALFEIGQGANDMSRRIQWLAQQCPETAVVVGGYSTGALVADVVVGVPTPVTGFDSPLPASSSERIVAVAVFGNGARRSLGPVSQASPGYAGRAIDQCVFGDPVCSGGDNWSAHNQYLQTDLVYEAAVFTAAKVLSISAN